MNMPMNAATVQTHLGVRFAVEAVPAGDAFEGRFMLLDGVLLGESAATDTYRPATSNAWATETEALTYATEAAHHFIEGVPPFEGDETQGARQR